MDVIETLLQLAQTIADPETFKNNIDQWKKAKAAADKAYADLDAKRKDTEAKVAKAQADLAKSQKQHDDAAAEVAARIQVGNDQIARMEAMQKDHERRELNLTRLEDQMRAQHSELILAVAANDKRKSDLDARQAAIARREARLKEALS